MVIDFREPLVAVDFCLNSERIIKIRQYLPKLYSNEKGSSFLTHSVLSNLSLSVGKPDITAYKVAQNVKPF